MTSEWNTPFSGRATNDAAPSPLLKRILIVDDDVDVGFVLGLLLSRAGFDTRIAIDGRCALRAAEIFQPDVAVIDVGLPDLDGYQVAAVLRQRPGSTALYMIAMSGYALESDRDRARAAGFDSHLTKPFDVRELRGAIGGSSSRA